jgi:hypothetical protein
MRRFLFTSLLLVIAVLLTACPQAELPPTPGFELSLQPSELSLEQGDSGSVTVNVSRRNDFTGPVTVTLVDPPTGISADPLTIAAGETSGTLTVQAASDAVLGAHNVTVRGASGNLQGDATLSLTVTEAPEPVDGLEISLTPDSLTLEQGQSGSVTVSVSRLGDFTGPVEVTLVDPPAGVSADPLTVAAGDTSGTLNLHAAGGAPIGIYGVTVRGTGNGFSDDATLNLTVTEAVTPPGFSRVGEVSMWEFAAAGIVESFVFGSGEFFELLSPIPINGDPFEDLIDVCFVEVAEVDDEEPPFPFDPDDPIVPIDPEGVFLDAGDPLTVTANGQPYTTLNRQVQGDIITYGTNFMAPPPAPLPDALSIAIPGAEGGFPAFSAAFPSVPAFALTSPADVGNITVDTTFTWTGATADAAVLLIGGQELDEDTEVVFFCVTRDDGSFSFPPQTQEELAQAGFTSGFLGAAGRLGSASYTQADAALTLSVARLTFYDVEDDNGFLLNRLPEPLRLPGLRD